MTWGDKRLSDSQEGRCWNVSWVFVISNWWCFVNTFTWLADNVCFKSFLTMFKTSPDLQSANFRIRPDNFSILRLVFRLRVQSPLKPSLYYNTPTYLTWVTNLYFPHRLAASYEVISSFTLFGSATLFKIQLRWVKTYYQFFSSCCTISVESFM